MIGKNINTAWLAALAVTILGCSGCNGKVIASAAPPSTSDAGLDSTAPVHDAGADVKQDSAPQPHPDASVKPGCDPSGILGEVECCGDKLCRGFCAANNDCWCGNEIDDPGCPEGTVCCEDEPGSFAGLCTSEAVCNGTFDPDSEKLAKGSPDGGVTAEMHVICKGKPCIGHCVLDPQGHEHCSCYGLDGGCPNGMICCSPNEAIHLLPGCGTACGIFGPQ